MKIDKLRWNIAIVKLDENKILINGIKFKWLI